MHVFVYAGVCVCSAIIQALCSCSTLLLCRLILSVFLRVWEKASEEAVKLELELPYLFIETRPVRLGSGWRGTLWQFSFPQGTFKQNYGICSVVNHGKKTLSWAVHWLISNLSQARISFNEKKSKRISEKRKIWALELSNCQVIYETMAKNNDESFTFYYDLHFSFVGSLKTQINPGEFMLLLLFAINKSLLILPRADGH